MTGIKHKKS